MKFSRAELRWAGAGALLLPGSLLFCVHFNLISIQGRQLPPGLIGLFIAGFAFLGAWMSAAAMRRQVHESSTVFYVCVIVEFVLVAIGILQLSATAGDRLLFGTELIWCMALGLIGAFAAPVLNAGLQKRLEKRGCV